MHKYLLTQIDSFEQVFSKTYKTREAAIKAMGKILFNSNNQVDEIVYHTKHCQEFICTNSALRFHIDRI